MFARLRPVVQLLDGQLRDQRMIGLADLLRPFALSIHARAAAVRDLDLTANQRARVLESISHYIKKGTIIFEPRVSMKASQAESRCKSALCSKN